MNVKPIQEDVQVSEVGQNPNSNKVSIDSQILPLPPMTMGEFEDLVGGIVHDSTQIASPKSISIDEQIVSAKTNSGVQDSGSTVSSLQEAVSTVSGLESRVLDMLAQMESKVAGSFSSDDNSGLTTRDYVDKVLGGERNLEGQGLVSAGNDLGQEEGITFKHNSSDNTFDMMQGGEIIQEDMTPREANNWIEETEKAETSKNDEASAAVAAEKGDSHQPEPLVSIINDEDIATASAKPFSFDGRSFLFINDNTQTIKLDLFKDIQDTPKKEYYAYKFDVDSDGKLDSSPSLVHEDANGGKTIPTGIADLVTFEGSGSDRKQTKIFFPFALSWDGEIQMLCTGGVYKLFQYCLHIDEDFEDALFPQKLI
tara:strand:- start:290 stop:1393 length:1104 start_codon:yes stop_codon:yes gene_type:complete